MSKEASTVTKRLPTWLSTLSHGWPALGILFLLGLGCSSVPPKHFFTVDYVLPPSQQRAARINTSVRFRPLDVARPYDTRQIVFRLSPYEIRYYKRRLWATKPQKMLTGILFKRLERARLFSDFSLEYKNRRPDYELRGELIAIEKIDSGDIWFAHLATSFALVKDPGKAAEKVVWEYQADKRKQIYDSKMVIVVRTISELFEEVLQEVENGVLQYMESHKG